VGSSVSFSVGVSDWWEGELLQCRENIPLAVMGLVSLAVLFVFGFSEMEACSVLATGAARSVSGVSQ
jgi:hypothetical protein